MSVRILTISGSLREVSSNTALLDAAERLSPPGVTFRRYLGLNALPHFNPDLDVDPLPGPVADLRAQIGWADGIIISSPEYARGVAGVLKNALDWLVSSFEFPEKPVALFNASPRASAALAALRLTLETMSARIVDEACITVALLGTNKSAADIAADPDLAGVVGDAMQTFAQAVAVDR